MSITALDIIDRLPYDLQARLQADDFFVDIPIVVADEGNVRAEIEKRQAAITTKNTKRGVAVIVLQVLADDEQTNIQFGPMTLRPAFQVIENLELNRDENGTGKTARKVARRIRDVVKGSGMTGLVMDMKPDKPCIEPINVAKELGASIKAYQVNFRCLETPQQVPTQVQMPQFVPQPPNPQFTITCPTAGALVYYTTDDSYPWPENPRATAYVPGDNINIPGGAITIRACAYVQGMIASWVNRATITTT